MQLHPQSYRPDLPTFSPLVVVDGRIVGGRKSILSWALSVERAAKKKRAKTAKSPKACAASIRPTAPHVDSYRPDLPLRASAATAATITAEDRAYYAAHPITIRPYTKACCLPDQRCEVCRVKYFDGDQFQRAEKVDKARSLFAKLNVSEEG